MSWAISNGGVAIDNKTLQQNALGQIEIKDLYKKYDSTGTSFLEGDSSTDSDNSTSFQLKKTMTIKEAGTFKPGCQIYNRSGGVGMTLEIRKWNGSTESTLLSITHGSAVWETNYASATAFNVGDEIRFYIKSPEGSTNDIRNAGIYGQYTLITLNDTIDTLEEF